MNERKEIEPFEQDYENVHIWIYRGSIEIIREIQSLDEELQTGGSYLTFNANAAGYENEKDVVGRFLIVFRNQGNDFRMGIFLEVEVRVRPKTHNKAADTAFKLVHFLFEWVKKYVNENKITDMDGELFVIPHCYYIRDWFEVDFPG